jgi:hypothetical protein
MHVPKAAALDDDGAQARLEAAAELLHQRQRVEQRRPAKRLTEEGEGKGKWEKGKERAGLFEFSSETR